MKHCFETLVRAGLLTGLVWNLTACPQSPDTDTRVEPDAHSGPDVSIAGANGLFDMVLTDSLDAEAGDNTDHKYIDVFAPGEMDVRVRFHETGFVGAVALLNAYGELLSEVPVGAGGEVLIDDFGVLPGRYFVRVRATDGASDYSIGRELTSDPNWLSAEDREWIERELAAAREAREAENWNEAKRILDGIAARFPEHAESLERVTLARVEVDDDEEAARLRDQAQNDDRPHRPPRDPDDDEADEDDDDDDGGTGDDDNGDPDDGSAGGGRGIRANITTQRDRGAGAGTTLVLAGCGTSSGLSEGEVGRISGTSYTATISRILGSNNCEAQTNATPGAIRSARDVEF